MELILENFKGQNPVAGRIEALKTLTKLLLYEVESLAEISPAKTNQTPNETINLNDQVQRYEIDLICKALVSVKGNQSLSNPKQNDFYLRIKHSILSRLF